MNIYKRIALYAVGFVVVSLVIKGLSYTYAEHQANTGKTYQDIGSFKDEYLASCVNTGGEANRSYCGCTFDYLVNTYGDARVEAIALSYVKDSNSTPPEMTAAVNACIDQFVVPPTTSQG